MKTVKVQELQKMRVENIPHQLIDVRELAEFETGNLGALHIPMGEIPDHLEQIRRDVPVIIHCRSGARSGRICQYLEDAHSFSNVFNLEGGIMAWAEQIDPSVEV